MNQLLSRLTQSLSHARNEEELVRPLLEMLAQVTQLESTYLTTIDFQQAIQHVLYARNSKQLQIPEGLSVPWHDTLCQRALHEGRLYTPDVQERWSDSQAASALGICTYISAPVQLSDGQIYGTLCAASASTVHVPESTMVVLDLFAKQIAYQVEREKLMEALKQRNEQLIQMALTDPLTQLPNRTALIEELQRLLARAQRDGLNVLVAFVDLDGFKQVNDVHGHAAGDRLLCTLAQRMQQSMRGSDMLARIGGDEFVLLAYGPDQNSETATSMQTLEQRLREATVCEVPLNDGNVLLYNGASVGLVAVNSHATVDEALQQADAAMYADKQKRRALGLTAARATHQE